VPHILRGRSISSCSTRGEFGFRSELELKGSCALSFGDLIRGFDISYRGDS
jgi:hypothetical protein